MCSEPALLRADAELGPDLLQRRVRAKEEVHAAREVVLAEEHTGAVGRVVGRVDADRVGRDVVAELVQRAAHGAGRDRAGVLAVRVQERDDARSRRRRADAHRAPVLVASASSMRGWDRPGGSRRRSPRSAGSVVGAHEQHDRERGEQHHAGDGDDGEAKARGHRAHAFQHPFRFGGDHCAPMKVLVVDDEPAVRDAVGRALTARRLRRADGDRRARCDPAPARRAPRRGAARRADAGARRPRGLPADARHRRPHARC